MNYCKIKPNDVVNGEGVCVSLWTQGCVHKCKGCFNPETWDFKDGKRFGYEELVKIMDLLKKDGVHRNLSILGGEPLCPDNIYDVLTIVNIIKGEMPDVKIFVWTGYTFEELLDKYWKFEFKNIDVLIDGKFEEDKQDIRLKLRGSSNQRIIDVKKTIEQEKIVEIDK